MNSKILDAFNKQLNEELASAYLYFSMAAWFESKSFKGMASWMKIQAQEEVNHAMKFYDFINERGGAVKLEALKAPQSEWSSPRDAFEAAYKHEQYITGCINNLLELAASEKDHAATAFLQWFVTEQVEEEASTKEVVDMLDMVSDHRGGLFMIDRELGQRKPPAPETSN